MPEQFESGPEQIPTKEGVMERVARFAENAVITRELSDDRGLYLLEAEVRGGEFGDTTYLYTRKGDFPSHVTLESTIHVVYYKDGDPVGGRNIANFKSETGQWEDIE